MEKLLSNPSKTNNRRFGKFRGRKLRIAKQSSRKQRFTGEIFSAVGSQGEIIESESERHSRERKSCREKETDERASDVVLRGRADRSLTL